MREMLITIEGPTAIGKSQLAGLIKSVLKYYAQINNIKITVVSKLPNRLDVECEYETPTP